jgi:hypothetical protein
VEVMVVIEDMGGIQEKDVYVVVVIAGDRCDE